MASFVVEALKRARRAADLTQAELAQRAEVGRMTVQQIETGAKDPRLSTLTVLFRALGLELIVVPSELRVPVEDFIRSGGRVVTQPSGIGAPRSVIDQVAREIPRAKS